MSAVTEGLRARTRRRVRQEIADAAMELFRARGFDEVTVAEVARAAGVAEKTVYNHFPTKPELVFDAEHDLLDDLLAAVRDRPAGCAVPTALRRFLAGAAADLGADDAAPAQRAFRRLVAASPALQAHQRQMAARYEQALARVLAEETGLPVGSPEPFIAAVGLVGALRAGFEAMEAGGGRAAATDRALDLLEAGLAGYATKTRDGREDP